MRGIIGINSERSEMLCRHDSLPDAKRAEALVLSMPLHHRVVTRQSTDTIELKLAQGQWTDENGVPIEFVFCRQRDAGLVNILDMPQAGRRIVAAQVRTG